MMKTKCLFTVMMSLGMSAMTLAADSSVTMVKAGVAVATIVVPQAPGPSWYAAGELQYHIKKITGATLPVVKTGEPVKGTKIFVGMTPETREYNLKYHAFLPQEYCITNAPAGLILIGRDPDADEGQVSVPLKLDQMPEFFTEMGTLYAVYDFLERACGVRWYAPTDEGMVCPHTNTLAVTVEYRRRTPALEFRQLPGNGEPGAKGLLGQDCTKEDQARESLRLKMGGKRWVLTHSFEGYPDRFWEKNPANPDVFVENHPDYFMLNANGERDAKQMCFSSTGLLARVIQEARDYFTSGKMTERAVAGKGYYCIGPRDSPCYECMCRDCQAQLSKKKWDGFSTGRSSDLVWGFVNKVQKAINVSHPGKRIGCFAYADYAYYPEHVNVDTNIFYGGCLHSANWFAPWQEATDMEFYHGWRAKLPRNAVCLWLYQCFPWERGDVIHENFRVFPSWHAHTIDRQFKMFARDGVRGVFLCGITPYIDGYLTLKLMDDPTLDMDSELDRFFAGYYGAASAPMKKLYLGIEATYMNPSNYPPMVRTGLAGTHQTEELAWYWLGRPQRMKQFGVLMDEARAKADTEIAQMHVAAYEKDFWATMQEGFKTWTAKQLGGQHPYPFMPISGTTTTMKLDKQSVNAPFIKNAYFRNGSNPIGKWETGFDPRKGTMEAWVWCGPAGKEWCQGPGTLFEIRNLKPECGHRVWVTVDVDKGCFMANYETWVGSKTNRIVGKAMKTNEWHHISATWQADENMSLCADSVLVGKAPYRITPCGGECFSIGYAMPVGTNAASTSFGPIAEVRLSNVTRKPVRQKAPYKTDPNTLLLLHFDEPEGSMIKDSSQRVR